MRLKAVSNNNNTDYYLEVASEDKYETANSMRSQFEQRFELQLQKIAQSLERKGWNKESSKSTRTHRQGTATLSICAVLLRYRRNVESE